MESWGPVDPDIRREWAAAKSNEIFKDKSTAIFNDEPAILKSFTMKSISSDNPAFRPDEV